MKLFALTVAFILFVYWVLKMDSKGTYHYDRQVDTRKDKSPIRAKPYTPPAKKEPDVEFRRADRNCHLVQSENIPTNRDHKRWEKELREYPEETPDNFTDWWKLKAGNTEMKVQ